MRICVYGAGAVGGLVAAWLFRSKHDVSVVARGAHLEAIRASGLRVRSRAGGEIYIARPRAESDPARLGPQDYVIVAVKAQSLAGVAERIGPLVGAGTSILTAMNGVPWWFFDRLKFGNGRERLESLDPGGKLARAMPTGCIVGCVIHLAASTPEPGLISHNMGRKLIIGEPGGRNGPRTTIQVQRGNQQGRSIHFRRRAKQIVAIQTRAERPAFHRFRRHSLSCTTSKCLDTSVPQSVRIRPRAAVRRVTRKLQES